jgi:uncharacterized membrane protein YfcA
VSGLSVVELALVVAIVTMAFTSETALGFGATIITLAFGTFFLPLDELLAAFVPLNVFLSVILVARTARHAAVSFLLRSVLPWLIVGLPLGMFGARLVREEVLKCVFGLFVLLLAALEIARASGAAPTVRQPTWSDRALLTVGGVIHGAFATGGPMVVFVLGRTLASDKATFRATLSLLWLVLNAILLLSFAADGRITADTLPLTGAFVVALLLGFGLGEVLFRCVSATRFRSAVFAMLGVAGLLLLVTNARKLVV